MSRRAISVSLAIVLLASLLGSSLPPSLAVPAFAAAADPDTNHAPVAVDDHFYPAGSEHQIYEDPPGGNVDLRVLANDVDGDAGDTLTIVSVTQPRLGAVRIYADSVLLYSPRPNANGIDSFSYTVKDRGGLTDSAVVAVRIVPQNDPPVARPADEITVHVDTPAYSVASVAIPLDAFYWDADGDRLTVEGPDSPDYPPGYGPRHGTLHRDPNYAPTTVLYTADKGYEGRDSFCFRVREEVGTGWTLATVRLEVHPPAPRPYLDRVYTREDVPVTIDALRNDGTKYNRYSGLGLPAKGKPAHGTATTEESYTKILYTPDAGFSGWDVMNYRATGCTTDTRGEPEATIFVHVQGQNYRPEASNDWATTAIGVPVTVDVLLNDVDKNLDPLTISDTVKLQDGPLNGTAQIADDHLGNPTSALRYTPNPGFVGTDLVTYQVSDGAGGVDEAYLVVVVVGEGQQGGGEPGSGSGGGADHGLTFDLPVTESLLASEEYLVAVDTGVGELALQAVPLEGGSPWRRDFDFKTPFRDCTYLWKHFLVCDLQRDDKQLSVLDASDGGTELYQVPTLLAAANEEETQSRPEFFADYVVGDHHIIDRETKQRHSRISILRLGERGPETIQDDALQGKRLGPRIGQGQFIAWDEAKGRPLLLTLPDSAGPDKVQVAWQNVTWDENVLAALPRLGSYDGFPILVRGVRYASGQRTESFYVISEAGLAEPVTWPADLALPSLTTLDPQQFVWTAPSGNVVVAELWFNDPPQRISVALTGDGKVQGTLRLGSQEIKTYGLDGHGNLVMLFENRRAGTPQPLCDYSVHSYSLPELGELHIPGKLPRDLPFTLTRLETRARLIGDRLFVLGFSHRAGLPLQGLLARIDVNPEQWVEAYSSVDYNHLCPRPWDANSTHLFVGSVRQVLGFPLDFSKSELPDSCGLAYVEPVYTESVAPMMADDCPLPVAISVPEAGGSFEGRDWHTGTVPGEYGVTWEVAGTQQTHTVEVLDINRVRDSDGDGLVDGDEKLLKTCRWVRDEEAEVDCQTPADTDGDGVPDGIDLSPKIDPEDVTEPRDPQDPSSNEWLWYQYSFTYLVRAMGFDGRTEVWDGNDLKKTCEAGCTADSCLDDININRAISSVLERDGYEVSAQTYVWPPDAGQYICVEGSDPTYSWPKTLGDTFKFSWRSKASLYRVVMTKEGGGGVLWPSKESFFRHQWWAVDLPQATEQWIVFQFRDRGLESGISYADKDHYRLPAFQYAFSDLATPAQEPGHAGLAQVLPEGDGLFEVRLHYPRSAWEPWLPYLALTPVWVEKNGESSPALSPAVVNLSLTGLLREIVLDTDEPGRTEILVQHLKDLASLWAPIPDKSELIGADGRPKQFERQGSVEYGLLVPQPDGGAQLTTVDRVLSFLGDLGDIQAGVANASELVEEVVKFQYSIKNAKELDDLDDLPQAHWARGPGVRAAWAGLNLAAGVAGVISDGGAVVAAGMQGDTLEMAYYVTSIGVNGFETAADAAKAATTVFRPAKGSRLAKLGKFSGSSGLDAAGVGLDVFVGLCDWNRAASTNDEFMKRYYKDQAKGDFITAGVGLVGLFVPEVLIAQLTWDIGVFVYGLVVGEDDPLYKVLSTGYTLTLWADILSHEVPQAVITEAHTHFVDTLSADLKDWNDRYSKGELGYLTVVVGRDDRCWLER